MFKLIRTNLNFIKQNRDFSKIAGLNLFSKIGDRLFYTVMLSIAASLPEANIAITIIAISETLPLLLGIFLGSFADQQENKPRQLTQSALFRFVLYLIIGMLLNYLPTLLLVSCISLFNLLSDFLGNYSSALIAPFTKVLVQPTDMPKAQSIISLTSQLISALATFLGAYLMSLFLPKTISWLNAGLFLLVAIGFYLLKSILVQHNVKPETTELSNWLIIKNNLNSLLKNKIILNDLTQLVLLNGVFGGLTPIYVLFLQSSTSASVFNSAIMISLLSITVTLIMIIGNSLSTILLKTVSNHKLAFVAQIFVASIGIGFIADNIYIVIGSTAVVGLLIGIISPRFTTLVIQKYPATRLGGIVTTVNSFLVMVPPLTSFLFPVFSTINLGFTYSLFIFYAAVSLIIGFIISQHK